MKNQWQNKLDPSFLKGIAHRGLHDEKMTENGLLAFSAAIEKGLAFEFDIHLSLDGELIVCHDSELKRTTGKEGIIEELTAQEIRDGYRLLDGEVVPTLKEVLALNQEKCLMVVELKCYGKNYRALGKAAHKLLMPLKDHGKIVLISFDPRALLSVPKKDFYRSLLVCKDKISCLSYRYFLDGLDLQDVLVNDKRVIKYRKKGYLINVWTIENEEAAKKVAPYVDTITFQHMDSGIIAKYLAKK